jgi:hypothetical protein
MRRKLQDERCDEGRDVRTHVMNLQTLREEYTSMGGALIDSDFAAIILGSLPPSYDIYLSAIAGSASISGVTVSPAQLISAITDEYDRRLSSQRSSKPRKDEKNVAFSASGSQPKKNGKGKKTGTCHNCSKKGHWKRDCWAEGGDKFGQGSKQKAKGGKEKDKAAAAAVEAKSGEGDSDVEYLWMAVVSDELEQAQDGTLKASEASGEDDDSWFSDDLPELGEQSDSEWGSVFGDDDYDESDTDSLPDLQSQSESESGSIFGDDDDDESDTDSVPDLQSQSESESGSDFGDDDDDRWNETDENLKEFFRDLATPTKESSAPPSGDDSPPVLLSHTANRHEF